MPATLIKGRPLADDIRADAAKQVAELGHVGLVTVLVGEDPASEVYIRLKHKAALAAGFDARDLRLPENTTEDDLVRQIAMLNDDREVDAILVQLPLPKHLDERKVIRAISPMKDVDGLHPFNAGQLFLGKPTLVGATPLGIIEFLHEERYSLDGVRACVIGRSTIVGKPMAHLLLQQNATVTICHSHTKDLPRHTLDADLLVAAVGVPGMVTTDMVKTGAFVVDVGINRTEDGLVGDVDPAVVDVAAYLTPVPGGVGPMTIALLLQNAIRCARFCRGELAFPS
jgi:methylenetetrahydrofolate dehydrogenase (NADP+)/methenyltetrahydrofolate cyclohydrolase